MFFYKKEQLDIHKWKELMIDENKIQTGDVLWVRETFYAKGFWDKTGTTKAGLQSWTFKDDTLWDKMMPECGYRYQDSVPDEVLTERSTKRGYYKRPSIFMPKKACRTFLRVTNVRIEKLQDISQEDSKKEGIENICEGIWGWRNYFKKEPINLGKHTSIQGVQPISSFCSLWGSINGVDSWNDNPYVWVYDFEKINKPQNF